LFEFFDWWFDFQNLRQCQQFTRFTSQRFLVWLWFTLYWIDPMFLHTSFIGYIIGMLIDILFLLTGLLIVFLCHFLERFCEHIWSLDSVHTSQGWSLDLVEDRWLFYIFIWHIRLSNIYGIWDVLDLLPIHLSSRFTLIGFGFTLMNAYRFYHSFVVQWDFQTWYLASTFGKKKK